MCYVFFHAHATHLHVVPEVVPDVLWCQTPAPSLLGVSQLASKISLIGSEMDVFLIKFAKHGKGRFTKSTFFQWKT